ncbi:MAG: MEDS domain-containing protein [Acidobacteria bacterium]|nr:MEDS domain-containing protein [Acidobacteriota bacterium]
MKAIEEINAAGEAALRLAAVHEFARPDWRMAREGEHFVQFYEDESCLLESLVGFFGEGLEAGDSCVVVSSGGRRGALEERLRASGYDVDAAEARGRYVALDAEETLAAFTVNDSLEARRFEQVIGGVVARAAAAGGRVRAYGDMVSVLCTRGRHADALRLEEMWNELGGKHAFSLFCAYPLSNFEGEAHAASLAGVCAGHARVIPAESYSSLASDDERLRVIARLQQKANSLEAEIAERMRVETELRALKEELEVQVEDLRRLHELSVGLAGTLDAESVLVRVLRGAMSVHGTDMGLLSLCDPARDGLDLKAHSGFGSVLDAIEFVPRGGGACGTAYEQRERIVIEDVEVDPVFAPYRGLARAVGFRAVHSTPLFTRGGEITGVLSVHFREPRQPTEREVRLMDLYARMAADVIECARLYERARRESEERARLLESERLARAEAEAASRLKDEFLATVSHELRTPLNAIMGWSHMLGAGGLDAATRARAVETIERNAQAQAQLIEDILDVSRVITGKLSLDIAPVDVASVINAAVDSVQLAADAKGIQLEVSLDRSARNVAGDAARLRQVVWNLVSNAIKFTPASGRVRVGLEHAGAHARLTVSDTGCGIAPEFLPHVFDRFRQADGTSTRRHGGLGLGLAIVRHLVELHGGTVAAQSGGEGRGATFTVTLPLALDEERATRRRGRRAADLRQGVETAGRVKSLPSLEGVGVLVVDDDADALRMLDLILAGRGARVVTASSVAGALEALEAFAPAVVVSDLAMPGDDGYALVERLRALDAARGTQTPAVALTAYARVEDRARALAAGFNMFVAKPVELDELVTAVAHLAGAGESSSSH